MDCVESWPLKSSYDLEVQDSTYLSRELEQGNPKVNLQKGWGNPMMEMLG